MQKQKEVVAIALLGFGRAGKMHLPGILANFHCHLKYIVDVEEKLDEIRETLRGLNVRGTIAVSSKESERVVMNDPDINAVMVTSPTEFHEYYVLSALRHGKAVFCEKPIAGTMEATQACYDEAKKAGLPLLCAFNRRFDYGMASVQERVRDGQVGKLHIIKTTSRDSPLPAMAFLRTSSGMFHDCAIHDIDVVCWVAGSFPEEVFAHAHTHHSEIKDMGDVDTVAIVMKFKSGIMATIDLSRHSSYGYDQRLEVLGEKGMILLNNVPEEPVVVCRGNGCLNTTYQHSFPQRYREAYCKELEHFVNVVLGKENLKITEEDTLGAMRVVDACVRSYHSKKMEPVQ